MPHDREIDVTFTPAPPDPALIRPYPGDPASPATPIDPAAGMPAEQAAAVHDLQNRATQLRRLASGPDGVPSLAELGERFGRWRATEDDAEITAPPYWCRDAELDDASGAPGTAYVIGADHRPDWPGYDVHDRGAVAAWTRVVRTAAVDGSGAPAVEITSDDRVDIIGNDVRTVRRPAEIHAGLTRLTPVGALLLVDALLDAVGLVTDLDPDDAVEVMHLALHRADAQLPDAGPLVPGDERRPSGCTCAYELGHPIRRVSTSPGCPVHTPAGVPQMGC